MQRQGHKAQHSSSSLPQANVMMQRHETQCAAQPHNGASGRRAEGQAAQHCISSFPWAAGIMERQGHKGKQTGRANDIRSLA